MRKKIGKGASTTHGDGPIQDGAELDATVDEQSVVEDEPGGDEVPTDLPEAPEPVAAQLGEMGRQLSELTEQAARHHDRAAKRELVIDTMHAELEQLRLGERRSLLRPLLTEVCRTRDDLLRQADTLPESFDRDRAVELLRSFAGSLEFALEDNGVTTFIPEVGESFQARLHRAAGRAPTQEVALVGTIAGVVSPGYRDIEADAVIATARVVVHVMDDGGPENHVTS